MCRKSSLIFVISLIMYVNSFGQDSSLQAEFIFFPFVHTQEYNTVKDLYSKLYNDYSFQYKLGPAVLISIPLFSKFSLTSGVLFFSREREFTFNDSVTHGWSEHTSPTNYIYKINKDYNEIRIPVNFDYCLFKSKRFYFLASGGFYIVSKYKITEEVYYYPDKRIGYIYKSNGSFLFDNTLVINLSLKYYFLKHIGVTIRPFAGYDVGKNEKTRFSCGLGFGICYK